MTGAKMETVNATGDRVVDIFKSPRVDEFTTQLSFILDEMVERGIFDKK